MVADSWSSPLSDQKKNLSGDWLEPSRPLSLEKRKMEPENGKKGLK